MTQPLSWHTYKGRLLHEADHCTQAGQIGGRDSLFLVKIGRYEVICSTETDG